eukprot:TRINITY_DN9496_c0_g1_i1.p1 TRINITY_DN9496_c0_g1~~TRINITY_DN9496_c0_g1_i1.p1  ORF type:complete len:472 (+),score=114.71 TRINITY_DN9496_c0_g1_i1:72-1487(+)
MPELPEVERERKRLHVCVGKTIKDIQVQQDTIVFEGVKPDDFASKLIKKKIVNTNRKGKYFWAEMDIPPHPAFHLGMDGKFKFKGDNVKSILHGDLDSDNDEAKEDEGHSEEWPPKFWKCIISFDDGTEFAIINKRRLGRIWLFDNPWESKEVKKLGFDPLTGMPSYDDFVKKLGKFSKPIKSLLLDQSFAAGVGNWIADEILYQSKIHPHKYTTYLSAEEKQLIYDNTVEIIKSAVEVNAEGRLFPTHWLFHHRWQKGKKNQTKTSEDEEVSFVTVGGRTAAYVKSRQILDDQSQKKIDTLKKSKKKKKQDSQSDSESTSSEHDTKKKNDKKRKRKLKSDEESDEESEPKKKKRKTTKKPKYKSSEVEDDGDSDSDFQLPKITKKKSKPPKSKKKKNIKEEDDQSESNESDNKPKKKLANKISDGSDLKEPKKSKKRKRVEVVGGTTTRSKIEKKSKCVWTSDDDDFVDN